MTGRAAPGARAVILVSTGLLLALAGPMSRVGAQSATASGLAAPADTVPVPEPEHRLYAWLAIVHVRERHERVRYSPAVAFAWRGLFAGALRNSYNHWSFTAGYEEDLLVRQHGIVRAALGYRAGLLTGYHDWQHSLGKWPLIPFGQLRLNAMIPRIGVELGYAGIVATGSTFVRF